MNLENIIVFLAEGLPYLVAALFAAFALSPAVLRGEKARFLALGFGAALLSRGFVELIRAFVHRPRPFVADASIAPLIQESSFSFPSGHAAFFFALATVAYLRNKHWGALFFVAAIVIGAARVAAGVHYASDIFGGAALGIIVGFFAMRASRLFHKEG